MGVYSVKGCNIKYCFSYSSVSVVSGTFLPFIFFLSLIIFVILRKYFWAWDLTWAPVLVITYSSTFFQSFPKQTIAELKIKTTMKKFKMLLRIPSPSNFIFCIMTQIKLILLLKINVLFLRNVHKCNFN